MRPYITLGLRIDRKAISPAIFRAFVQGRIESLIRERGMEKIGRAQRKAIEEEVRADLFRRLIADVEERRHVDTGIHGTWFLVKLLLERRRADLLHLVASQRAQPSWGHMLAVGTTTICVQ